MPVEKTISKRQQTYKEILKYMKKYFGEHGYMPSFDEIGAGIEIYSKSTINLYMHDMLREGMIETDHYEFEKLHSRAYRIGEGY